MYSPAAIMPTRNEFIKTQLPSQFNIFDSLLFALHIRLYEHTKPVLNRSFETRMLNRT